MAELCNLQRIWRQSFYYYFLLHRLDWPQTQSPMLWMTRNSLAFTFISSMYVDEDAHARIQSSPRSKKTQAVWTLSGHSLHAVALRLCPVPTPCRDDNLEELGAPSNAVLPLFYSMSSTPWSFSFRMQFPMCRKARRARSKGRNTSRKSCFMRATSKTWPKTWDW